MSNLGNIKQSYGKQIGISIANTNGTNILASTILPKNNLIIASPIDTDANDIGTYALFMTDNNGVPIRLSYTIKPGNGLNIDENNSDIIKLSIDNKSLKANNEGVLYLSETDIIDNHSLITNENNNICINLENLNMASSEHAGVVGLDEYTIKTNQNGNIYVETENLDRANDNQTGVVTSDNNTINIDSNGVIKVNTENLQYASSDVLGIVKVDGHTLQTTNNGLSVVTNNLQYATDSTFGISKCDNSTIVVSDGIYSVNTNNLDKSSNTSFGIVKSDGISTIIDNDVMEINDYNKIIKNINTIKGRIKNVQEQIKKLSNSISNVNLVKISDSTIFTFMCNSVTSVNLTRPTYGTFPDEFLQETITAEFTVNTNCPFIINVTYLDNISPNIYLYEINYDDLDKYPGDTGLYNEFQSTNYVDKILRFSWICKNYSKSNGEESMSTRIKITISYSKDNTISKTVYYNIVRYNSLYNKNTIGKTILTTNSDGTLNINDTITLTERHKIINILNNKKQTT